MIYDHVSIVAAGRWQINTLLNKVSLLVGYMHALRRNDATPENRVPTNWLHFHLE